MIIDELDLLNKFKKKNILCYNASLSCEDNAYIEFQDFDTFMTFTEQQQIRAVFYEYAFLEKDIFEIDLDNINEYDLSVRRDRLYTNDYDAESLKFLFPEFEKYNKKMSKLDIKKPLGLTLFCVYQGVPVNICIEDYSVYNGDIKSAQAYITELLTKNSDYLEEQECNKKELLRLRREEFRNNIYNDPKFHICTNKELRRDYLYEIRRGHKEYEEFLINDCVNPNKFVEDIWKEYKESKVISQ